LAVLWDDGMVQPTPPVRRALRETVEKLRKAGHEVVDWESKGHKQAVEILARALTISTSRISITLGYDKL
jgi:amidase